MRSILLGLTLLASSFLVSPGKSTKPVVQPQPDAMHCPLTCGVEVTCSDGRVFCNCCLAREAGEKHCTGC